MSYASVANAYAGLTNLLATTALSATQKAAITITNVTHATPGDATSAVTAYTVVIKGNYPASYDMRLGDLQRSAMRILNIAMQSAPFGEPGFAPGRQWDHGRLLHGPVPQPGAGRDRDEGEGAVTGRS